MPFRHPDRAADLGTRIEFEVRERLEEALDYVCLDALVRDRKARGLPPPAADSPADRRAYADNVLTFLRRLRGELTADLSVDEQRKAAAASEGPGDEQGRLVALQVSLARLLPDYWQRFDAISAQFLAEVPVAGVADGVSATPDGPSRGESRGLFGRLFGRG